MGGRQGEDAALLVECLPFVCQALHLIPSTAWTSVVTQPVILACGWRGIIGYTESLKPARVL